MRLTREEMRARIEEALQALAPGPYERLPELQESEPESGFFLVSRSPKGAEIWYHCDEDSVRIDFGSGGGVFCEYNTADDEGKDNFTEEDLKDILKTMVTETLDIRSEKVFGASYKTFMIPIRGLFPVTEFDAMSKKRGFESVSWNGTYT